MKGFARLKSSICRGAFLRHSRGESDPLPFPAFRGCKHCLAHDLFSIFKADSIASSDLSLTLTFLPPTFSYEDCDCTGLTQRRISPSQDP